MQKLFVVSHTHWDREWYEPFQVYRARLIRCVDKLLHIFATDPDYRYFLLDGQTIILEDYLEVRPDREPILRDLVRTGRLQIGPWYVLPDEFLVSGEAIIRNLMRGLQIARAFGDTQPIGYIPDPFGHISQMPQILRGLGIDAAVFRRGLADEPTEVIWQAPDGSQVLACYLRDGYDNAAWLGHDDAGFIHSITKAWHSLAPHAVTSNILLLNGNDHMEPWADLSVLLRVARQQISDVEIIHASLPMYVAQVQADIAERNIKLDLVHGELRNPKRHHLLPGVTSTRMWIKQRNMRAQMLLEKWAEPFTAFAGLATGSKDSSSQALIHLAWKYLLQNHPHDSICGCGVDKMHEEMRLRFDWVGQIVEPVIAESLETLAAAVDTHSTDEIVPVIVFNAVAGPRTDRVIAQVEVPNDWKSLCISDSSGDVVPFQIKSRHVEEYYHKRAKGESLGGLLGMVEAGRIMGMAIRNVSIFSEENPVRVDVTLAKHGDPHPSLQKWQQQLRQLAADNPAVLFEIRGHSLDILEIEFIANDIPAHGYKTFAISKTDSTMPDPFASEKALTLENEFYRLEPNLEDGTLTIADKSTGQVYRGLNRFIDGGDRGDLYNYCPPENDSLVRQPVTPPQIICEKSVTRQSLHISMNYRLPTSLTVDRTGRSQETVDIRLDTVVSLYPHVRRIDFQTQVDNQARDHRLQIEFPTPIVTTHVDVDQAFDIVRRSIDLPQSTADWIEQPRPEAPMQNFVSISDGETRFTIAVRGLPEYQAQQSPDGTILNLTLLRCVGWLSRDDLVTRSGNAGPALQTPGAQEIGVHTFEYTLIPAAYSRHNTFGESYAFATPLRATTAGVHHGSLPSAVSFVEVASPEFMISAIKYAEDGQGLIVRGYNVSDKSIDATLRFHWLPRRIARVNLLEEEQELLDLSNSDEIRLPVKAKEIITLRITY